MAVYEYSYKFGGIVPLLTEAEWARYCEDVSHAIMTLKQPKKLQTSAETEALIARFEKEFDYRLSSIFAMQMLQLSNYGRKCPECSKLFRTPKAKICAECGFELPVGETAGAYIN